MRLDRRIKVYRKNRTTNEFGEAIVTLSLFANPWASVKYELGQETQLNTERQKVATQRVSFTVRYLPGILKDWVIEFDGEKYNVLAVQELQRRHYTMITTELWDNDREIS